MSIHRVVRSVRLVSDRALRICLSLALVLAYVQVRQLQAPVPAAAAPARLSVTASVSAKPLLGGKATVHVVVKNIDTTDKAYNISVEDTITSSRAGSYATFSSASDGNGAVPPNTNALNTGTGALVLKFINIRDLAAGESYSMDLQVDLGPDPTWQVGDLLQNAVRASGNTIPNQTIPDISVTTNASAAVLPIVIKSKSANQSTGVEQATGTSSRQYSYTINVQNNYTGPTQNVVVVDKLPDGVEFLGMAPASTWTTAPVQSRDASTGVTTLTWNLGTMNTSASQAIAYKAGIRYDWFGTNNGGKNRSDAATLTTTTAGVPIPDKTPLTNNVRLDATWLSNPASDTASAQVTAAYLTIAKGQTPTSGGSINTTISYTLSYYNSQYYSILSTAGSILVHDHLPDGQQFETSTANPAPTSVLHNPDGSADITWTVGAMTPAANGTITFDASVRQTWKEPGYAGNPVVSGDTMTNVCDIRGVYQDLVNPARPQALSTSGASSGYSTSIPKIFKAMKDPDDPSGPWLQNIKMSIGDTTTVRVQFNTNDGATPLRTNIDMGNIMLNDWLPAGMSIVPGSFQATYSNAGDFSLPATNALLPSLNLSTPTTLTVSGLEGAQWYIGDVSPAGWWQATFDVVVNDVPAAADGVIVANLWKLTGYNTFGAPYSDRAAAMTINYADPYFKLNKAVAPPSPLTGSSVVPYTVTMNNTGTGAGHQVSMTDTLPVGMRATPPSVTSVKLDASTLTSGTDYVTSWNPGTGTLGVSLQQGAVRTDVPGGSTVTVKYNATVDNGVGAATSLVNTATVSYSTRPTPDGHVTPGTNNVADDNTDNASIKLDGLTISKSGPAGPFTLGDTYGYDIDVTVPAHTVAHWPSITDSLNREGFVATGTPTIATISGSPVVAASFAATASAPVRSTPASGATLFTFNLNEPIDNSASATPYHFRVSFNVQYQAVRAAGTWEFQPPATTDTATDTASAAWNTAPAGARTTDTTVTSNSVATTFNQPLLRNVKTVTSPGPYAGGSTIDYQLVITNIGTSRAYDASIADTLPAASIGASLTTATLTGVGDLIGGGKIASFVATPTMKVTFDPSVSIGTTQTLTLNYRITLSPSIGAGVAFTNAADVNWASLPGSPAGSRVYNDGAQENWAQDSSTQTRNAATVLISKRASTAGPITIGDTITYSIDATVPANTVAWWPVISDTMDKKGVAYVPNSATLTTRSNPPTVPASFGATSAPTITVPGATTVYTWTLNNPIDNSGNPQPYALTLSFTVQVTGLNAGAWEYWAATGAQTIGDTNAQMKWRDVGVGGPATNQTVTSAGITTPVKQPLVTTVKSIVATATPGPYTAGSPIRYRVTLTNPGFATAYDLSVTDTFPAEVATATLVSATESGVGSIMSSATPVFTLPTSTVTFDQSVSLSTVQTITLEYDCQLSPTVGTGATLLNAADANWSSLQGNVPGERIYNDSAQEGATWVNDTTSVSTVTPTAQFGKRLLSGLTTATIGSMLTYSLDTTIPANTTAYSLVVTDTVPDYLTVLVANSSLPGTLTVGLPSPAGTPITYSGGNVVAGASVATISITMLCQVRDLRYSGPPTPNGAIANSAGLAWSTRASAGTTLALVGGPASFTVVQPTLTVSKAAAPTSAGPADTVTFTSVLTNTGNSTAFNPVWTDLVPATMTSPTLVAVKPSGAATLVAGSDYSTSSNATSLTVALDRPASPGIDPGQSLTITWTATVLAGVHNGTTMVDTATINSYVSVPTAGARTYASVSATRAVTALSPALVVTKSVVGSAYPLRGDTVQYHYTVRNVGTAPALSVVTTDTLPADLSYVGGSTNASWPSGSSTADPAGAPGPNLAWTFGGVTLAAGQTLTVDFSAVVATAAPLGSRTNTVTAAALDAGGVAVPANAASWVASDTNPTDSATVPIRIVAPGAVVAKALAIGQDPFVQVGQAVGWKITVMNTGDTTLTTVPLADTYDTSRFAYASAAPAPNSVVAGTLSWVNLGTIAPGGQRSVNVTLTATSVPASNVATNAAASTGTIDEFGHALPSSDASAQVGVTHPAVTVTKTRAAGQDATIQAGQTATFDIVVANTGDTTLTTVPLTDTFANANLAYTTATVAPNSVVGPTASWTNLGSLAPGASTTVTVTFTAIVAPLGNVTTDTARVNAAVDVHGDSPTNALSSATIAITRPAVTVAKVLALGQDPVVQVGQLVTYRITVTNSGDTTLASVPMTDTWDPTALGSALTAPAAILGANSATWTFGPLAPGGSANATVTLTALSVPSGQVTTDTATAGGTDVFGDPATGSNASASVRITHPAVTVTKALHAGQDPVVQVGQAVGFDITVKNTGDTTLTTVPLRDDFDNAAIAFSSAGMAPNSVVGGTATWANTGSLAPGASRTITATFTALAVPVGQITTDTARVNVAIDAYGDNPPNASDAASVRITAPSLAVAKTPIGGQDPAIQPGQTATFDIKVTNTGNTSLASIDASDTWNPALFDFVSSTVAPSAVASGVAQWTLAGPLAPGAWTTFQVTLKALSSPGGLTANDIAHASATDEYGDPVALDQSTASVLITTPGLVVTKALHAGQDPVVQAGESVAFDVTATNSGNTTLTVVPLGDLYDAAALQFVSATSAPDTATAGSLAWANAGSLAPGVSRTITVNFTAVAVPSGQVTTDTASSAGATDVYGDRTGPSSANASVRITAPSIGVTKTLVGDPAIQAGETAAFLITITNTGDTLLDPVQLSDAWDSAVMTPVGFAPMAPDVSAPGLASWNNVGGPLAPGLSAFEVVTMRALTNPVGQSTPDTATVTALDQYGDAPSTATDTASVKVTHPALTLTKVRTTDSAIQTSQTATFDLTVTNTGDTTLTTVPVSDTWDPSYLLFSASLPPTSAGTGFASWDVAPIPPGGSATVSLTLVALGPVPGLTTVDTATVTGALDENGDAANDASSQASVDITKPSVQITKTLHAGQDAYVQVGDHVLYDVTVTNDGDTTLTAVPLVDTYDPAVLGFFSATTSPDSTAPAGTLGWNDVGPLAPGAAKTVTIDFTAETTATTVTNTASVAGAKDLNGDPAPDVTASDSTLRITAPSITLTKRLATGQDTEIQPGQAATYELTVTNSGDTTLALAVVEDMWDPATFSFLSSSDTPLFALPGVAAWFLPSPLAPGDSATISVTLAAIATPAGLHSPDTGLSQAVDEFGDSTPIVFDTADILVTQPGVSVAKSLHAGQDAVLQAGEPVSYDIAVTNSGNTTLTAVPLADTYDGAALAPVSATPNAVDYTNDGTLDWANVGPIAPGNTTTVTVTFTALSVPSGQVTTDTATVAGASDLFGDPAADASSQASVRITAPSVSVVKSLHAGQDPAVQAGQPVTFDITVTNTGDTVLSTVPLGDDYDAAYLVYSSASPAEDTWTTGTAGWSNVGPLSPGESATVTVTYDAITNPAGQVTTDTASVVGAVDEYGDSPADASANAGVKITHPALALSKVTNTGQDPYIQIGQTATFVLTVTNTGDTTLTAPLTDTWDGGYLAFSSASVAPNSTGAGTASWTLGPIAPGDSASVDLTLFATGVVPGFFTADTAAVTGALDENADPANDATSSATIAVTKPSIAVTKILHAGQDPIVQVGQSVTYDIGVTNIGDITLSTVPLADTFDPNVFSLATATPAPDGSGLGSVSWTNVGPLNAGETTTVTVTMNAVGTSGGQSSTDTATVSSATDINDDPSGGGSATAAATVTRPEVTVRKLLADGQAPTVRLGDNVEYDIVVTNSGDTTLSTVPLEDTYDAAQIGFTTATPAATDDANDGTLDWVNVASTTPLAPGDSTTVTATFKTLQAGNGHVNTVGVYGARDANGDPAPDANDANESLSVFDPGTLEVTKTANPPSGTIVLPGQTITYTIAWDNTGGVSIPGVTVADPLPGSVSYVAGSLALDGTAQTDPADSDAGAFDVASHTVSLDLGTVSADSTGSATFKVAVGPENVSAAGVMNYGYFHSAESTIATAGPVFHPVDPFTISKVGKDLNGGTLKGGDTIEWTITVKNIGLTPTTHVVVSDTVPGTTTYVKGSIKGKGGSDKAVPNLKWDIGTMAIGEVQVLKFRSVVKKGLRTGTLIRNQATVVSDQSRLKRSDNPQTSTNGDPTILVARTSGSEGWRLPLSAGLLLLVAGMWLWPRRRRKIVPEPDRPSSPDQNGGGLDG